MDFQEAIEFDDQSVWPRRLLYIPTMTSYPWRPGDVYGGHARPNYMAFSYTWGRWRLGDDDDFAVKALPVQGVTWKLPRVNPAHFTAEEFEKTIRALPTIQPYRFRGKSKPD